MRHIFFALTVPGVVAMLVLAGSGCPPVDGKLPGLMKAALGSGCEGCGPTGPYLAINGGAISTDAPTVVLDNGGTESPVEYMASEAPDFAGAVWKPYSASPGFDLNGSAIMRTVYFKTRNADGESEVLSDTIYLLPRMVDVAAGEFAMGRDYAWEAQWGTEPQDETPVHAVTLDAYRIGKFEVTNRQGCDILNWALAQGLLFSDAAGTAWAGSGDIYVGAPGAQHRVFLFSALECEIIFSENAFVPKCRPGLPNGTEYSMAEFPMTEVTWYGAAAFCNWLSQMVELSPCYDLTVEDWFLRSPLPDNAGYRLPTEAEWERAAAWDPAGQKHWIFGFASDEISGPKRCNYRCATSIEYANPMGLTSTPDLSPVGWFNGENKSPNENYQTQLSRSPAGVYDMSGNVWEWCNDWYSGTWYGGGAMNNPAGPAAGVHRVNRGGDWSNYDYRCRSAERNSSAPMYGSSTIGLRFALIVSE